MSVQRQRATTQWENRAETDGQMAASNGTTQSDVTRMADATDPATENETAAATARGIATETEEAIARGHASDARPETGPGQRRGTDTTTTTTTTTTPETVMM
jgi:hypothetical protein